MRRRSRFVSSWIAALAVLMAALAPAVSQALGSTLPAGWIEVCSAGGTRLVAADGAAPQDQDAPGALHALEHCPYCALHIDALAVPPVAASWSPPLPLPDLLPAAFLHAAKTPGVWVSAQPRAPPFRG